MSKLVRKAKKFFRSPSSFFRDYFLLRAPLSDTADVNRPRKHDAKSSQKTQSTGKTQTLLEGFIEPAFPVDIVYTWVDADDPEFAAQRAGFEAPDSAIKGAATCDARFISRQELRYSLRSIAEYAPWVRNIYIVTNGQVPAWLDTTEPRVQVISHDQIIPAEYLPTFNSHVIESCLHRIPGLAEHYVYFNDDVMLLRPVNVTDFFTETGLMRGFVSRAMVPDEPESAADTPSMLAIKNARSLIFDQTGHRLSAKFAHTYQPQLKSVAQENERIYADAFHTCRQNKFRHKTDVLCTSFLHPCMAYVTGKGVFSETSAWYFNIHDLKAKSFYSEMLRLKGQSDCPLSVCLNDNVADEPALEFPDYDQCLRNFMASYYPNPASFEKNSENHVAISEAAIGEASITEFPGKPVPKVSSQRSSNLKAVNEK